mmetsp:Transcript_7357/g.25321  ORF Transcript_7357/g.25321 Transcript_7357/m.25321 type:complete len:244 (+) Transcript_7357:182-913(+)
MADEVELAAVPKQAAAPDGELSKLVAEPACVVHPKVGPRAAKELERGGHLVPRPPWKPPLREKCEPHQKGDKALETREVWVGREGRRGCCARGTSTHREGLADGLEEELLGQRVPELAGHRTCDPVPGREGLLPPPRPADVEHGPSPVVRHLLENEAEDETVVARAGPHQIARQRVPRPLGHRHAAAPAHLTSCCLSQVPLPLLWPAVETTDKRHKFGRQPSLLVGSPHWFVISCGSLNPMPC